MPPAITTMKDAARAPAGIHGDNCECTSRSPMIPAADARMKTASRHVGDTVGVPSAGAVRTQCRSETLGAAPAGPITAA